MKCMQTNFGGCGFSGFGDMAPFSMPSKMAKISLQTMDYACTPILVGVASLVSEMMLPSKRSNFPFQPWTIVHGHQKI